MAIGTAKAHAALSAGESEAKSTPLRAGGADALAKTAAAAANAAKSSGAATSRVILRGLQSLVLTPCSVGSEEINTAHLEPVP
jgi:hypothetical protein